jgi:hypothetical protein
MAKCMRENGVPDFPDPGPNGEMNLDGSKLDIGPGNPAFDKAEKACEKYMPNGAQKHVAGDSGGGTTVGRAG